MKLINSLLLSKAIFALFAASTVSAQTCDQENCGGQTAFCYSDGCASRSEDGIWTGAYAQCNPPDEVGPFYCDACYTDSACGIWDFSCDQENCGSYLLTPCYTTQGCASRSEDGTWNGPYATCNSPELPAPTYCDNCFPTCVGSTDNDSSPSPTMTMMPTTYDSPSPTMTMMPTTYDGPECIPEACQGMITAYTSSASSDESSDFEGPSCEDMQTLLTCLDDNDAEWQENCGEEQSDLSDSSDSTTTSTIVLSSLSIYDLIMLFYDQSCQSNSPSPTMTYSPSPSHSPSPSPSPSHSPSPSPSPSPTSAPTTSPLRTQTTEVKQTIKTESTLPDNTNHTNVINILVEAWCENLDNQYEDTTEALAKCTGNGTVTSKPEVGRRSLLVQSPRSRRFRRRLDEKVEIEIDMTVLVVETNPSVTVPPVVSATALTDAIDNDPLGFDAILDDIVTAAIAANLVPTTLNADNVAEIIVSEGGTSTNPPQAVQPSSGGMSGGAVAGIVVGGVAVLGLLGIAANEMRKKRNRDSGSTWGSEENDDELEQYEGKHNSRRSRANDYDLEVAKPEDIDFITSVDSNDDFKRSTSRSNSRGASSVGQVSVRGDLKALEMQISSGDNAIGRALGGGATQTMGFANSQSTSFGSASAGYDVETVYAPPGKLGVVVDSSHSGPCVHCVRDNSPLLNIIRVGDKILSIDDIDCRSMSAGAVTKLMAKKSGQKERKLVFAHQIDPQEGGG